MTTTTTTNDNEQPTSQSGNTASTDHEFEDEPSHNTSIVAETAKKAEQVKIHVDKTVEGTMSSMLGKRFPWLILFRELILDGLPMLVFWISVVTLSNEVANSAHDKPCCEMDIFRNFEDKYSVRVERNLNFELCTQDLESMKQCTDVFQCHPCEIFQKLRINPGIALFNGVLTLVFPVPYWTMVFIYWRGYLKRRRERKANQESAVLGDLYDNEVFWHKPRTVMGRISRATAFSYWLWGVFAIIYITSFIVIEYRDGKGTARRMLQDNWYPVFIALISIPALLGQTDAQFAMEENEDENNSTSAEDYKRTRARLYSIPLADLPIPIWTYLTTSSASLLVQLELCGLRALQKKQEDKTRNILEHTGMELMLTRSQPSQSNGCGARMSVYKVAAANAASDAFAQELVWIS